MLWSFMPALLVVGLAGAPGTDPETKPIPTIGPVGKMVRLHTGFQFTEGPATDSRGNVYFTDIPNNRIYKSDVRGMLSLFLKDSGACNGLMLDARGNLIACQGKTKRLIAIDSVTKKITALAESWEGKPLGTPNDLVIDQAGGVYFTAPDTRSVYHVTAGGKPTRVLEKLARPNGVILSPDEKTLYVLLSGSANVMAYPVESPGKIGKGKIFCKMVPNPKRPGRPGGDGLSVDTRGNLYLTRPSMKLIQVVAPNGKTLGLIRLPEEPSNCTFGGADMKTLFVTAQTSLYSMKMEAMGHRFVGEAAAAPLPEAWDYTGPMKKVATRFRGREGVVIHVGGSMTIANPYGTWARSGKGKMPSDQAILAWMHAGKNDRSDGWWLCRNEVKPYRAHTSESGLKAAMLLDGGKRGLPKLAALLDDYKPRMVTIECGIYDIEDGVSLDDYRTRMGKALDLILAQGVIPILNTVPPFKAQLKRTGEFNNALRTLAKERGIPLLDLEREILTRRPDDWFGKLMNRIHLTAGQAGGNPGAAPTAENLRRSGYLLRGWLTVRKIAEVKRRVLDLTVSPLRQELNVWIKRSPLTTAPPSPHLGYETSMAYDPVARRVIRWGGHAQGGIKGSGEQTSELWTLDPVTMKWEHKQPNGSPPPVCCASQQVFDTVQNRFLRIRAASGNHGWQWYRQLYLNNSSVWSYDLARNSWRDMRPLPEPVVGGAMHCASWDADREILVAFGGEGSQEGTHLYDPYTNTWTSHRHKIQPMSPRSGGNLAYDAARKLHILFGTQFREDRHTWAYDAARNEWRDLKPAVQPPTLRNDAVLAYDSANRVIVAVVRASQVDDKGKSIAGRLETWAFDAGENTWKQMKPKREPDGHSSRSRVITYIADQNLFLLEACINPAQRVPGVDREQQIWTYRFAEAKPAAKPKPKTRTRPRIVEDVVVSVASAREVRLAWKPPIGQSDLVGYHVERAVVEVFSEDEVVRLKKDTPPLEQPSVGAIKAIGAFQRLTREPVKAVRFTDDKIDLSRPKAIEGKPLFRHRFRASGLDARGKPYRYGVYAYRVCAVNARGEESGPSPYFLTIPSAPQQLFSREEGEKCHLRWEANPEEGIKGYRVYWMKGPRPEGPGQATHRLTADPIKGTAYIDAKAGKQVRRFWVVAVDALGQEGIPSSPTWHYRTQRKYYAPFVGEWHQ